MKSARVDLATPKVRLPAGLRTPAEWLAHEGAAIQVHNNGTRAKGLSLPGFGSVTS